MKIKTMIRLAMTLPLTVAYKVGMNSSSPILQFPAPIIGRFGRALILLFAVLFYSGIAHSAEISGMPDISDGDTLKIWKQSIRLEGIDAPETAQTCKRKNGVNWKCGEAAANYFQKITSGKNITCRGTLVGNYKRLLGTCFLDGMNINQHMVEIGMAVAYLKYSDRYKNEEKVARQLKKGIWDTKFTRPHTFRSEAWKKAEQPDGCNIKGNINSRGVKIYHAPWSRHYSRTKISPNKGERWFCSEGEALEAGWRAPYR